MLLGAVGVEYSYFEILFWPGGGVIGLFLWGLSVVMLATVLQCVLAARQSNILPKSTVEKVRQLLAARQFRETIDFTSREQSFFGRIMHATMIESPYGYAAMERAMEDAAEDQTTRLLRGIEYLNLLGNVGPMIGLLGTVWGMIRAFFMLVEKGGIPNPADLAGAIGIKLVCTFVGLLVAIPSLTAYGLLRNRIDAMTNEAVLEAEELISPLRLRHGEEPAAPEPSSK